MNDAMVTARMAPEKKAAGNRALAQLGMNASQVVNQLYDYVIEHRELPFPEREASRKHTPEKIAEAIAFVDSLHVKNPGNSFSTMTDKEIKMERLRSRGHVDGSGA